MEGKPKESTWSWTGEAGCFFYRIFGSFPLVARYSLLFRFPLILSPPRMLHAEMGNVFPRDILLFTTVCLVCVEEAMESLVPIISFSFSFSTCKHDGCIKALVSFWSQLFRTLKKHLCCFCSYDHLPTPPNPPTHRKLTHVRQ